MDELAVLLGKLLIERRDVKATQYADGHYEPDHSKFTIGDLRAHLAGERTYGHYLVAPSGLTRLFAYDIDLNAKAVDEDGQEFSPRAEWLRDDSPRRDDLTKQLRCVAEGLAARVRRLLDIPVAVAYSGNKGLHVYGLMAAANDFQGVPATDARAAGVELLDSWGCFELVRGKSFYRHTEFYPDLSIEVFPKQTEVAPDHFGNLLRLPLGVHRKTRRAGFFVDLSRPLTELAPVDPLLALQGDPWMGQETSR